LTIVGDFDKAACMPLLQGMLRGWKAGKPYERIAMPITSDVPGAQHTLNTPDKANATYVAGLQFPLRDDDADYPALVIGNYIFGSGALASRLGDRIRQKDGLSYSVGSTFSASSQDKRAGVSVMAICNPQNIGRVESDVIEELTRLLKDGVTADEVARAQQGYLQSRAVARANDAALAGLLSNLRHLDRTMAFEAELEKKIQALTPEQVSEALRRHIDPKKLVVVTAGDFPDKPNPAIH
jgi:zinc protease